MNLPPLPENSKIGVEPTLGGIRFYWSKPNGGKDHLFMAGLTGFLFVVGLLGVLFGGPGFGPGAPESLTHQEWQFGVILGFSNMGFIFFQMVRPQRPESIALSADEIRYDEGAPFLWGYQKNHGSDALFRGKHMGPMWSLFRRYWFRKKRSASLYECQEFVGMKRDKERWLEWVGPKPVTIGETLSGAEQSWLKRVLNVWCAGELEIPSQIEPTYEQGQA